MFTFFCYNNLCLESLLKIIHSVVAGLHNILNFQFIICLLLCTHLLNPIAFWLCFRSIEGVNLQFFLAISAFSFAYMF